MPLVRRSRLLGAVLCALLALAAYTGVPNARTAPETTSDRRVFAEPEEGAYPVTIKHGLGSTTISAQPQRVVMIGWAGADLAQYLGTVPVAQGVAIGQDPNYYPWFRDATLALGAPLPETNPTLERGDVDLEMCSARSRT